MYSRQLLFRASHATLLLVFCLQLRTNKAQDNIRQFIKMDFQLPRGVKANEEVTAKLTVETEMRECMVIKAYLRGSIRFRGSFNYKYTSCLCNGNPRNFLWDFRAKQTMNIAAAIDIVRQLNICPNNKAVLPIGRKRFSVMKLLKVI